MIDLCTLGTGGTLPMPDRALSSLYVRVQGHALVVDCGEGTQVGVQRLGWGFRCIDALLITHYHADHCSGLPGMLLAMSKAQKETPLHIYGPVGLKRVVDGLRVIAPELTYPVYLHELTGEKDRFDAIGLEITPFLLAHGMPCLGYRMHLPRQGAFNPLRALALGIPVKAWKTLQKGDAVTVGEQTFAPEQVLGAPRRGITLLYATDTRPVPAISRLGKGCDQMILEGMYGAEEKMPLALRNHHMLYREAAALARDAGAKALMLTHFSTSIAEPEADLPQAQEYFANTRCAVDGMTWTLHYPPEKEES